MTSPSVSVVIPCHGAAVWLPRFTACLKAQTYAGPWEAVFVDDGDAECDYAPLRGDPRLRLVRRGVNGGVSAARNAGLESATGEIVLFADPDDEVRPDWMKHLVEAVDGVDFAWGGFVLRSGGSERTVAPPDAGAEYRGGDVAGRVWRAVFGYRLRDVIRHPTRGGLWNACRREFGTVWCRAFRRSAIGDLRFDETLRLNEDAMFLAAFALRARSMRVVGAADYVYEAREDGAAARESRERAVENRFALRDARRRLDPKMAHWRGSFVLGAIDVLRTAGLRAALRYLAG